MFTKLSILRKQYPTVLFIFVTLLILGVGIVWAQQQKTPSLAKRWQNVEEFAEKQLPESALKELDEIIRQTATDNNKVEYIKAQLYKMRFTLEKDPEKAPQLIAEFEKLTEQTNTVADKALMQSMLAEMYTRFYQSNAWNINKRSQVAGATPTDLNEWTKNHFSNKIFTLLRLSVSNDKILKATPILNYEALLVKGDDSRNFRPTLFDFLSYRKLALLDELKQPGEDVKLPSDSLLFESATAFAALNIDSVFTSTIEYQELLTYQQLLTFHSGDVNPQTYLNNDIDRLNFVRSITNNDNLYIKALEQLESKYADNELIVEVIFARASFYFQQLGESKASKTKKDIAQMCQKAISTFPAYKRIGLLKNLLTQIQEKTLSVTNQAIVKPNNSIDLKVVSANIFNLKIETYRVNATAREYYLYKQNNNGYGKIYPNRTLINSKTVHLTRNDQYLPVDTTLNIPTNGFGLYEVVVADADQSEKPERAISNYTVTNLGHMLRCINPGEQQIYAIDRWSGQLLKNVSLRSYQLKWEGDNYNLVPGKTAKTDKNGFSLLGFTDRYYYNRILFFENNNDRFYSAATYSYYQNQRNTVNNKPLMQLFTDRALYRPGQTVYFKGISYFSNAQNNSVEANVAYEVNLFNANNEKISTVQLKTNTFGSFSGQFILPSAGLNGAYTIKAGNKWHTIYVEEYKRPGFEVNIERPKKELGFNETVTVQGEAKALAGYAVANAQVKYRITRASHNYCWWWQTPEVQVSAGELQTDDAGKFNISFKAEKPQNASNDWRGSIYTYTISTDITDTKGETQQGKQTVSVGDKSLFILCTVPDKVNKVQGLKADVYTETINGEKLNSVIEYTLYSVQNNDYYIANSVSGTLSAKVVNGKFNSADKNLVLETLKLKSGQYRLVLTTKDSFGREVKTENDFVLYSNDDKRPPVKTYTWLQAENTEPSVGEKTIVHFGTSTLNTPVLYELMQGNKLIESRWITFNNEMKDFSTIYKQEYGAGYIMQFSFMKDGDLHTERVIISRKKEQKQLTPTLSVFRNKLQPGEKAEWTISIPESANPKKAAELLIGMYDASLDAIRSHNWSFSPVYTPTIANSPMWTSITKEFNSGQLQFPGSYAETSEFKYDALNWFGVSLSPLVSDMLMGKVPGIRIRGAGRTKLNEMAVEDSDVISSKQMAVAPPSLVPDVVEEIKVIDNTPKPEIKIRTNFNETAFFYPQLLTDEKGLVKVSFTAPESLTRWNIKMLAHTADLFSGYAESQLVTQKELMVQMNLPRFVRRSDSLLLAASVVQLSDKMIDNCTVELEVTDPLTNKTVFNSRKSLALQKGVNREGKSTSVSFHVPPLKNYELLICKMVATTGQFSDGEQKYLPVLPDKVLVTETLPFTVRANSSRNYRFEKLLKADKSIDNHNLAIEMAANPAWYAVQALPSLAEPEGNNAFDLLAAIYANTLAAYIVQSNPSIVTVFNQWKQSESNIKTLQSQLDKNQELKNMMLDETPWVMAARNEADQKQRIAQLFDQNKQHYQTQQMWNKLLKLQTADGGFTWFDGMPASRYITQEIVLQLGRLSRLTAGHNPAYETALKRALVYLDSEIARDFFELKKYNKKYLTENCTGNMQLFYLHLRSEFSQYPIHISATEAVRYYTEQSEKYWTSYSLYGKAMMAVVAHRNGKINIAQSILKSLRENALQTDEMGMYWAKNTAGYFWNERPVAVQAAIIEAFSETGSTTAELDELKIWLLKQKQTQRWDSPIATVNAVYALLMQGNNWLSNNGDVQLQYGTQTLHTSPVEAGTGYIKTSVSGKDIKRDMGQISVRSSQQSGISWGAAYWQYYQEADKVTANGSGLRIAKTLYVKTKGTTVAIPLAQATLKTGDRVMTRLVLSTDRNLEFVALKDLRAACLEPVEQRSGCAWKESVCYYQTTKDASTQFFFSYLPKGTYVFEYEQWVNNAGTFSSGMASVQCQYAPEFTAHSSGEKITVLAR